MNQAQAIFTCSKLTTETLKGMKSVQLIETPKRLYVIIMSPRRLSTSESTLYNYVNVKELLARKRSHISSSRDCKGIRTYRHLVCKRTLTQPFGQTGYRYVVFIGNFEQILDLSLMFVYLTLNRQMLNG